MEKASFLWFEIKMVKHLELKIALSKGDVEPIRVCMICVEVVLSRVVFANHHLQIGSRMSTMCVCISYRKAGY